MNCLICRQAHTTDGFTSILFERGELKLVVHRVPARVCPHCGEAYVDEDIALRLLQTAEDRAASGDLNHEEEYSSLP
jgi:YgiT-type zinc finger domain-containing protein